MHFTSEKDLTHGHLNTLHLEKNTDTVHLDKVIPNKQFSDINVNKQCLLALFLILYKTLVLCFKRAANAHMM